MSKDYKVQWTPELREAVDNRIIDYLSQGYSQQEAEDKALLDLLDHTTFNFSDDVVVTAKAPEKKQVAVETDWDPGYTKFISGQRYYADKNHKNYLDWLRNDMTNSIRETTDKWGHAIGSGIEIASGFTPLWWVAPAVRTGLDLSEGDYKGAALNAGLAFAAPYAVGKGILYITPYAKSAIIASKLNRQINKTKLYPKNKRIVEKLPDYLYHNEFFKWPDRILNPKHSTTNQIGKQLHSAKPAKYDYIWWDKGAKSYPAGPIVRVQKPTKLELHPNTQEVPGITGLYINDNYYVTPALHTNIDNMVTFRQLPDGSLAPYSTNRILNNRMSLDEMFLLPITSQSTQNGITSKTSLAFFERQPANISEAERLGIPKGDRGNLSASQQEAVRDLHHYITDGKFRLKFLFDTETNLFFWGNAKPTPSTNAITTIAQHPQATIRLGDDGIGYMRIPTEYGTLTYFPHLKTTSHTISFPKSEINPQGFGEAAARAENLFGKSVILTSPKTDAIDAGVAVEGLSSTVPKRQVYDFYKQLALTSKSGTYVTGDAAAYPLGLKAIMDYAGGNSTKAIATILSGETPTVTAASRTGLSPDSYISLLRSAQRPEWKLSFNRKLGFGKWNNSAVNNSDIYDAWKAARNGSLEDKQAYIKLFNDWVAPYGGAPAYLDGKGVIIHPHPFIVRQKAGGSLKIANKNKGKFAKVRDYVDYKNNK